jgi:hypothetical protein
MKIRQSIELAVIVFIVMLGGLLLITRANDKTIAAKSDTIRYKSDTIRMLSDKQAQLYIEVFVLKSMLKECQDRESVRNKPVGKVLNDITEWNKKHQK